MAIGDESRQFNPTIFDISPISLASSKLYPLEDRSLEVQSGHECCRLSMVRKRVSLGFTCPSRANGVNDLMPRSVVSKLRYGDPLMS